VKLLTNLLNIFSHYITNIFQGPSRSFRYLMNFYLQFLFLISNIIKGLKNLRACKSFGDGDIPIFVITDCSIIFVPVLKSIFNLSLSQKYFPALWKQA
jgi:hypothetical protein